MLSRRHLFFAAPAWAAAPTLRLAHFEADVTPPLGAPLCISLVPNAERVESPLLARGIVLYPSGQQPIVLCAVDWISIGNGAMLAWKAALARAVKTVPTRVAVHTVHQHDAPGQDDSAYTHLLRQKRPELLQPAAFAAQAIERVAAAAAAARPQKVSHMGTGQAEVSQIASNRRILSPDGKQFVFQRFTACRANPLCDAPLGTIDPLLKTVSFHDGPQHLASLHYYATHPMSYYGKGVVNPDFVGLARQTLPGFHVYFTGAAGNIGAGKFNDGNPANRAVLAERLADAMKRAFASQTRRPVGRLRWATRDTLLPHRQGPGFSEGEIRQALADPAAPPKDTANAARYLAWWERCQAKRPIDISCLHLDEGAAILHLPGELFVEYQLAAQRMAPNKQISLAAYGDYGPMYIGTAAAYNEGGYETSAVSRVGPAVEEVLLNTIRRLVSGN
jgi:hypothetical protein